MKIYNKLVRDKIPSIIKNKGEKPITRIAGDEEYEKALQQKLHEEVEEFLEDPSTKEAADVIEVLRAICEFKEIDLNNLEAVRQKKLDERGGFEERIILERVE